MTDLSVFAEAGFDAKAWINAACAGRPQQEPLERFLAELEMRLQVWPAGYRLDVRVCGGWGRLRVGGYVANVFECRQR